MNAVAILVATAVLGVDYGWHRLPNGEWEYIIQVEPALVETLVQGQALVSQMPPELAGVRRFRVQVGDAEVPREQLPVGGVVGGIPVPGALGGANVAGNLPGGLGPVGTNDALRGGAPLGAGRAGLPVSGWPIGVDPRAMAQLRTYEWVTLEPITLLPLENDFLRQLGGPEPIPQNARPWEQFSAPNAAPTSRWPGANRPGGSIGLPPPPLDDRTASGGGQFGSGQFGQPPFGTGANGNLASNWNQNNPTSPWRLDDRRGASNLPGPAGDDPRGDRELDQFDLNDEPQDGGSRTGAWPNNGGRAGTGQLASRGTQRGALEDRRATRGAGTTAANGNHGGYGASQTNGSPFTTARHMGAGVLNEQTVGAQVWWPLTMTVVLLFASLGGNLYLAWLALDFYRRYREAAWELRSGDGS